METGIFLMKLEYISLGTFVSLVKIGVFSYVTELTLLPLQLGSIYHCDIPTTAVYDDGDTSVRDTVYVGLYTGSGGMITMY